MTYPPPSGDWNDPTRSSQQPTPQTDPTLVAGPSVPTQPGPADPYAPVAPYADPNQPPAGYAVPGYPPPYAGYGYPPPQKTNGTAIAALVLALIGLSCGLTAPVGAILGHVAQKQIRLTGEAGEGMAKAAIIVGWVLTGLIALVILGYVVIIIVAVATGASSDSSY
ncbi:DUF4190 domain-containing protein [Micromonospora sp. CPCC 205539]|uniref:DUF4190 domain-containing protein n=1 Tax=Micromonospora sp. CPCC 205539 TaxID=3122408 RepID=UPI002FEF39C3